MQVHHSQATLHAMNEHNHDKYKKSSPSDFPTGEDSASKKKKKKKKKCTVVVKKKRKYKMNNIFLSTNFIH